MFRNLKGTRPFNADDSEDGAAFAARRDLHMAAGATALAIGGMIREALNERQKGSRPPQ